jgi:hypothetical protein
MKTLKIITLFTTLLSISTFAQNYECSANMKNQKPFIFKIENNSKGLFLKFDNAFLNREYKVDYQGWGARDYKAKAESMLVASTKDNGNLIVIYWESGAGFGFAGFGKGFMKIGDKMEPGFIGKYTVYDVDCKKS